MVNIIVTFSVIFARLCHGSPILGGWNSFNCEVSICIDRLKLIIWKAQGVPR